MTSSASNPSSPEEIEEILELIEEESQGDLLSFLKRSFGDYLPSSELELLRDQAVLRRFSPGSLVFREGEVGKEWGVVLRGVAEVRATYGGKELVVGRVGPGEIVGEVAILREVPRTSSVIARDPLELYLFPGTTLGELAQKYSSFRTFLEQLIHDRAEATIRILESSSPS